MEEIEKSVIGRDVLPSIYICSIRDWRVPGVNINRQLTCTMAARQLLVTLVLLDTAPITGTSGALASAPPRSLLLLSASAVRLIHVGRGVSEW